MCTFYLFEVCGGSKGSCHTKFDFIVSNQGINVCSLHFHSVIHLTYNSRELTG